MYVLVTFHKINSFFDTIILEFSHSFIDYSLNNIHICTGLIYL